MTQYTQSVHDWSEELPDLDEFGPLGRTKKQWDPKTLKSATELLALLDKNKMSKTGCDSIKTFSNKD